VPNSPVSSAGQDRWAEEAGQLALLRLGTSCAPLVQQAREAGLGVTIHVGEEGGAYGIAEIREVVSTLRPDRIGHGILAARDRRLMGQISEASCRGAQHWRLRRSHR
jgi:hypothetical protein